MSQIKHIQSGKYAERVDKTIMKSVFLGTQKKYLKNATDKYNIPFRELSPFLTKVKQDKNHMVNAILTEEKTKRD